MFSYDSKDAATAWDEGLYPATFIGAIDDVSKTSGQPMQVWTFEVYDNARDRKQTIKEYVTKASLFKVRQLAGALNRAAEFKANNFNPEDYLNSSVMVELKVEQQDGYDDKNRINRISAVPPRTTTTNAERVLDAHPVKKNQVEQPALADSDIPF